MRAEFYNPFEKNTVVELTDITEFAAFEDLVANVVDPDMNDTQKTAWDGRSDVKDLVRPPKFNGRIVDIELSPLEEPFAKLLTSREDGWSHTSTFIGSMTERNAEYRAERCLGFHFSAIAKSSGRGAIGQIQAGLWYLPVPRWSKNDGAAPTKVTNPYGGRSVERIITKPRLETANFTRLNEESARIALASLRIAMMHPLRIGMHN